MLDRQERRRRRITLGADKGYDSREFIAALRERRVTPHVAQNESGSRSAVDGRDSFAPSPVIVRMSQPPYLREAKKIVPGPAERVVHARGESARTRTATRKVTCQ